MLIENLTYNQDFCTVIACSAFFFVPHKTLLGPSCSIFCTPHIAPSRQVKHNLLLETCTPHPFPNAPRHSSVHWVNDLVNDF